MSSDADSTAPAMSAEIWDVPNIDGSDGRGYVTAGRLQRLQDDAREEAKRQGYDEGLAAGKAEIGSRVERLEQLLHALHKPFEELDDSVEAQLVELSIAIVKQLFRREVKIDPGQIIGVARDAIKALPIANRNVQLHLHPDDAELVRQSLTPTDGDVSWVLVEDPLITRGGCRVTSDASQIDATAEARIHKVLAAVFDDERIQ